MMSLCVMPLETTLIISSINCHKHGITVVKWLCKEYWQTLSKQNKELVIRKILFGNCQISLQLPNTFATYTGHSLNRVNNQPRWHKWQVVITLVGLPLNRTQLRIHVRSLSFISHTNSLTTTCCTGHFR